MDNLPVHVNARIPAAIEEEGHIVRYLPPYSPDFNPIELMWAVLKAWIRRWHLYTQELYRDYGEFLERAIRESRCDFFARKQFQHAAGGIHIEQAELERLRRELERFERGVEVEGLGELTTSFNIAMSAHETLT